MRSVSIPKDSKLFQSICTPGNPPILSMPRLAAYLGSITTRLNLSQHHHGGTTPTTNKLPPSVPLQSCTAPTQITEVQGQISFLRARVRSLLLRSADTTFDIRFLHILQDSILDPRLPLASFLVLIAIS